MNDYAELCPQSRIMGIL